MLGAKFRGLAANLRAATYLGRGGTWEAPSQPGGIKGFSQVLVIVLLHYLLRKVRT